MKTLTLRLYRAMAVLLAVAPPLRCGVAEAVAYLENEVPRWKRENGCFSCHNNGDGARALMAAQRAGYAVKAEALQDSLDNLAHPDRWEQKTLAAVSFAAAIPEAGAGLDTAVAWLLRAQEPDGHWRVDEEKMVGSPVTYGPVLATALALQALERNDARNAAAHVARAKAWLAANQSRHAIDIAARLLVLKRAEDAAALAALQAENGSWGGEAFDTALAVMALAPHNRSAAGRGRSYLLKTQLSAGGWAATTRPGGGDSYAQHIATTAWALMALLDRPATAPAESRK